MSRIPLQWIWITGLVCISTACQVQPVRNHLSGQSNVYLRMHMDNPVDWHPWSPAAFEKARRENKMVLISIGYSSCHWCHVMEEEAFSDTAVANYMNDHFVSIKVDREEMPDVDAYYMQACLLAQGGSCGWPLNTFALPDGRPVYSGTYYPIKRWMELLEYFIKIQDESPEKLEKYATELQQGIRSSFNPPPPSDSIDLVNVPAITKRMLTSQDWKHGGLSGAPKFPMPLLYQFLLTEGVHFGDTTSLQAVFLTLDRLNKGGIYDQLEGGFARYATDEGWRIPHFEKMLYDNALLIQLYAQAYKANHNPDNARILRESLDFVFAWLAAGDHFYSSVDANSEGEEGRFYQWTWKELKDALPDPTLLSLAAAYYDVTPTGNWELGKNILQAPAKLGPLEDKFGMDSLEIVSAMAEIRTVLRSIRSTRTPPVVDEKVITSWNALMIQALVESSQALGNHSYRKAALATGEFIWNNLYDKKQGLYRIYQAGTKSIYGHLEDYAYLIKAYIDLYALSFDKIWLNRANTLMKEVLIRFDQPGSPLLFSTSMSPDPLIAPIAPWQDQIIPSANATIAEDLFLLASYLDVPEYSERSKRMTQVIQPLLRDTQDPYGYLSWLSLAIQAASPRGEIAIIGDRADEIRYEMQKHFLPLFHFLGSEKEENLQLLKGKYHAGQTWIYICQNGTCKLPVQDVQAALALMDGI